MYVCLYVCMCVCVLMCVWMCVWLCTPSREETNNLSPPLSLLQRPRLEVRAWCLVVGPAMVVGRDGLLGWIKKRVPLIATHLHDGFSVAMLLLSCVYVNPVSVFVAWRVTITSVCGVFTCVVRKLVKCSPCCSLTCHFTTTDRLRTTAQLKLMNSSWI